MISHIIPRGEGGKILTVGSERKRLGLKNSFFVNSRNLGNRKCPPKPRPSFVRPAVAIFFQVFGERVFQHPGWHTQVLQEATFLPRTGQTRTNQHPQSSRAQHFSLPSRRISGVRQFATCSVLPQCVIPLQSLTPPLARPYT